MVVGRRAKGVIIPYRKKDPDSKAQTFETQSSKFSKIQNAHLWRERKIARRRLWQRNSYLVVKKRVKECHYYTNPRIPRFERKLYHTFQNWITRILHFL